MADVFTQTTGGNAAALIAGALDLKTRWFLTQLPQFRQHVDVRPVSPAHDGPTVTVTIHGELAPSLTPLAETVDVDARDIPATRQVTVGMNEYGAANIRTLKVETIEWSNELGSTIATQLADSMQTTMDLLVRAKFDAATNVWWLDNTDPESVVTAMPGDGQLGFLNAETVSASVAALRSRRTQPRDGTHYLGIIHPHVSHDLRREAGPNTWSSPHEYQMAGPIFAGEVGTYAGARLVEHNRARIQAAQGTGLQVHYTSYFLGREAMLEACAIEPHAVIGPVTDKLNRFRPVGWHGYLGWEIFRQNAIQNVKTESSLGPVLDMSTYDPKA